MCSRYLYTDTATLRESNVYEILNAAIKYCVQGLIGVCEGYLSKHIRVETLASRIELSIKFDLTALFDACIQYIVIRQRSFHIFPGNHLNSLSSSALEKVISSEYLAVNERDIFTLVIKHWAKEECNRRDIIYNEENIIVVLGKLLFQVRFPLFDAEEIGYRMRTIMRI